MGAGQGMGRMPNARTEGGEADADEADAGATPATPRPELSRNRRIPLDPELTARLDEVRRAAEEHAAHEHAAPSTPAQRRAPRPERLQR